MDRTVRKNSSANIFIIVGLLFIVYQILKTFLLAPMTLVSEPSIVEAEIVNNLDDWEVGEPLCAEMITPQSLGPRAGETVHVPGIGPVICGEHAQERHGVEALQARSAIMTGGGNRYDCGDGRQRILKQLGPKSVAIMIVEQGVEVSCFISSKSWERMMRVIARDDCSPPQTPEAGMVLN